MKDQKHKKRKENRLTVNFDFMLAFREILNFKKLMVVKSAAEHRLISTTTHTRLQRNHVATKGQVNVSRLNVSLRYTMMNGPEKQCPLERTRTAALSSAVQSKNTQNSWHFIMALHSFPEAVVVVTLAVLHKSDLFPTSF